MRNRDRCLEVIRSAAADIARVARKSPDAAVPRYPGSDVSGLVRHMITIHEWVARIVAERLGERASQDPPSPELGGDALVRRFEASAERLVATLEAADPKAPVWTFGADRTVSFWVARMAHETAIHAWDAASAVLDDLPPIPSDVALSGLAEGVVVHCERPLRKTEVGGSGETIGLACTDADVSWTITLHPVGIVVTDGTGDTDAAMAGTAAELWLALGGRLPFDHLETTGDAQALQLFREALESIPAAM